MSNHRRIIYPVGQGAFYAEIIDNKHTFIYDCGNDPRRKNSKANLNKAIDDFIHNDLMGHDVDGLFISHFHSDHISGIPTLIEKLKDKKIKRVFIPKRSEKQRNLNIIDLTHYYNWQDINHESLNNMLNLVYSPTNYFRESGTEVIEISNEQNNESTEPVNIESGTKLSLEYNSKTALNFKEWIFIPFNYQLFDQTGYDNFMTTHGLTEDDFKNIDENKWNKIKNAAEKSGLNKNESSMVLFSCNQSQYSLAKQDIKYCDYCHHDSHRHGCYRCHDVERQFCNHLSGAVYFGDYPTRNKKYVTELMGFLNSVQAFDKTSLIQISHHGSRDDFNGGYDLYSKFKSCLCQEYFICYGTSNSYRHPYPKIFQKLSDKIVRQITEEDTKLVRNYN